MIIWDILNSLARAAVGIMLVWKLIRFHHTFNGLERFGMSIGSGSAFMTIPVIWAYPNQSPFSGWAATIFTWAMVLYFSGRVQRLWRHERANKAMHGGIPR